MISSNDEYISLCKWKYTQEKIYFIENEISENDFLFLSLCEFENFMKKIVLIKCKINIVVYEKNIFGHNHYNSLEPFVNKIYATNSEVKMNDKLKIIPIIVLNKDILPSNQKSNLLYKPGNTQITNDINHQISRSKYVYCEENYGIDSTFIFQSLLHNSIPIIKKNQLNDFYQYLPVLIVDNIEDFNDNNLNLKYNDLFKKLCLWKKYNKNWLSAKFWIDYYDDSIKNIVIHHQGFGDYLSMVGAVKFLSTFFRKLDLIIRKDFVECMKEIYYEPNINFISYDKNELDNNWRNILNKYKVKNTLYFGLFDCERNDEYRNNWNSSKDSQLVYTERFYNLYELDYEIRYKYFNIQRDYKKETDLFNKYVKEGDKYIIYHEDENRNILLNKNLLPQNIKKININQISTIFIDIIMLLDKAEEIHIIDSSHSIIIYLLQHKYNLFNNKKIFLHTYLRTDRDYRLYDNPKNNWIYL
jgi:hypothetical protein